VVEQGLLTGSLVYQVALTASIAQQTRLLAFFLIKGLPCFIMNKAKQHLGSVFTADCLHF
jgi:hypothetical protein